METRVTVLETDLGNMFQQRTDGTPALRATSSGSKKSKTVTATTMDLGEPEGEDEKSVDLLAMWN